MKRHWIDFQEESFKSPMSFWVHRPVPPSQVWIDATEFDPPLQPPVPDKGYPVFNVEIDGFTFFFASFDEISECIRVLGTKVLPRTLDLSAQRETTMNPNAHWLSRLPARTKSWKYRQKAVAYLNEALAAFEKTLTA